MRIAVTGAGGFIGRAVTERIEQGALGTDPDLRLNDLRITERAGITAVPGSFADPAVRDRLLGDGVDLLFHLASLPGGAAHADFALGRAVNLDATLALLDEAAAAARSPIVVYTSSIAAFGAATAPRIDRDTRLRPNGSYGTHKAMVELYLADLSRIGAIDGRSVRPAGIVARPRSAYAGFATAWLSEMFRAGADGADIVVPRRAESHIWVQSVAAVADAIVHAATIGSRGLGSDRVWTLPATVARLDTLAAAIARRAGKGGTVRFGDARISQLPLDASDSLALGFRGDGDVAALVDAVFAQLEHEALADARHIP